MELSQYSFFSKDGTPLRIYDNDAGGEYPIHGAYYSGDHWIPISWSAEGKKFVGSNTFHVLDIDWDQTQVVV